MSDAVLVGTWVRPVVAYSVFVVLAAVAAAVYLTRPKQKERKGREA